jgi:hypothetical protein
LYGRAHHDATTIFTRRRDKIALEPSYMSLETTNTDVRSEQRGPHWVAWIPNSSGKPQDSVVLVGRTREDAEARARLWVASARRSAD